MAVEFSSLEELIDQFDGILLDAYGVFWNGNSLGLMPNAEKVFNRFMMANKHVGILSNSSQLAEKEKNKLEKWGIFASKHYHFYLTSGEIGKNALLDLKLPFPVVSKKFFPLFKPHPQFSSYYDLFKETSFTETFDPSEADFIYLNIPHIEGKDQTESVVFQEEINRILPLKLPMICFNPDKVAFEGNPLNAVIRQGAIGSLYEKRGGKVHYTGKPYPQAFQIAIDQFEKVGIRREKIVMIGDNPETDIRGANQVNLASALITETGVMGFHLKEKGSSAFDMIHKSDTPSFYLKSFNL